MESPLAHIFLLLTEYINYSFYTQLIAYFIHCYPPIALNKLIIFCDCLVSLRVEVRFATHVSVSTPKLTNPYFTWPVVHFLYVINIPLAPLAFMDVDWFNFFCIEKLTDTSLFPTDIYYDRICFLRLYIPQKFCAKA